MPFTSKCKTKIYTIFFSGVDHDVVDGRQTKAVEVSVDIRVNMEENGQVTGNRENGRRGGREKERKR